MIQPQSVGKNRQFQGAGSPDGQVSGAIPGMKTALWAHQATAFDQAKNQLGWMLALDMGCGKTATALALANHWGATKTLIICPKKVINVWPREIAKHCHGNFVFAVLDDGKSSDKATLLISKTKEAAAKQVPLFVIVNYESVYRPGLATAISRTLWSLVICDESHRIKAANGSASRFIGTRIKSARRLALTGTPMPHSPLDLYGQFRWLDPKVFGTSYQRFKMNYAITNPTIPGMVVEWKNLDDLMARFHNRATVVRKEDALDLPEAVDITLPVKMSRSATKISRELIDDFYAKLDTGEITASNALVKLLRLQQITSGFAMFDDGTLKQVDDAKAVLLADLLEDIDRPAVVFTRFVPDLDQVEAVCKVLGRRYGEISGRRSDLTKDATMPDDVDVMAVQLQAGGVGIDLTRASIGVYYSLGFNLGDVLQSRARLHRPGQANKVTYYHLIAEEFGGGPTIDTTVYRALEKRKNIVDFILAREL